MATRYDCKFVEVSALLSLKVDELLAGLVRQIQLNAQRSLKRKGSSLCRNTDGRKHRQTSSCVGEAARGIVTKLLKHTRSNVFSSCDNLLVL